MSFSKNASNFSIKRVEKTTDYIFGVSAAVVAIRLEVPTSDDVEADGLGTSILDLNWKKGLWQIYGQLILLIWWILHNDMIGYIRTANRSLVWFNSLLLSALALSIYTCLLWIEFSDPSESGHHSAFVLHLSVHCLIGMIFFSMWLWSSWKKRFILPSMSSPLIRLVATRILLGPLVYGLSIGCSFYSMTLAMILSLSVILTFLLKSIGIDLLLVISTTISSFSLCCFSRFPFLRIICPYSEDSNPTNNNTLRIGENKFKININRLLNLMDAFFVTLIALLVIELDVPTQMDVNSESELYSEVVVDRWQQFLCYAISALFLLLYWSQISYMLGYLDTANTTLATIHLLMIIGLSFLPFLSGIMYNYIEEYSAILYFYLGLMVVQISQIGVWCYIHYSQIAYIDKEVVEKILIAMCINVVVYSICLLLGFFSTYSAIGFSILIPILNVVKSFGFDVFNRIHRCLCCLPEEVSQREMRDQTELLIEGEGQEILDSDEEIDFD